MDSVERAVFADVSTIVHEVLEDDGSVLEITSETSFSQDLGMMSVDVVSLAGRLQAKYGKAVNFVLFAERLDIDSLSALRVGDLVDYIVSSLKQNESVGQ